MVTIQLYRFYELNANAKKRAMEYFKPDVTWVVEEFAIRNRIKSITWDLNSAKIDGHPELEERLMFHIRAVHELQQTEAYVSQLCREKNHLFTSYGKLYDNQIQS